MEYIAQVQFGGCLPNKYDGWNNVIKRNMYRNMMKNANFGSIVSLWVKYSLTTKKSENVVFPSKLQWSLYNRGL